MWTTCSRPAGCPATVTCARSVDPGPSPKAPGAWACNSPPTPGSPDSTCVTAGCARCSPMPAGSRRRWLVNAARRRRGPGREPGRRQHPVWYRSKHQYVVSKSVADYGGIAQTPVDQDSDCPGSGPYRVFPQARATGSWSAATFADPDVCWPPARPARRWPNLAAMFEPDLDKFAESWASATPPGAALRATEIARVVHGPEAFTPDGEFSPR